MNLYKFIQTNQNGPVGILTLNNPKKANALNKVMWGELYQAMLKFKQDEQIKAVIVCANGKHFTSGIDLGHLQGLMEDTIQQDRSEQNSYLKKTILEMQKSISLFQDCHKPVIAAVHGVCIGAGVDLITACDIRLGTVRSYYSVMETKLGIVADMGTLQRISYIMGDARAKELCLTSKIIGGYKAKSYGLLNEIFFTKKNMMKEAMKLALHIADLPEHAVQGTKQTLNYCREHTVLEGLEFIADLNSHLLLDPRTKQAFESVKKQLNPSS